MAKATRVVARRATPAKDEPPPKAVKKATPVRREKSDRKYNLEIKTIDTPPPSYVGGSVTFDEKSDTFTVVRKRPRSSKVDTFRLNRENILAAALGEDGYVYTDHPDFQDPIFSTTLVEAAISDDGIWGKDVDGNDVFVNEDILDLTKRWASYSE